MQAIEQEIEEVKKMTDAEKERKVKEAQMEILPMIDELLKLRFINQTIAQRQDVYDQQLSKKFENQMKEQQLLFE